jgi:hypothetical protein
MLTASTSILALRNAVSELMAKADKYDALAQAAVNYASRAHFLRLAEEQREQAFAYNECLGTLELLSSQPDAITIPECASTGLMA